MEVRKLEPPTINSKYSWIEPTPHEGNMSIYLAILLLAMSAAVIRFVLERVTTAADRAERRARVPLVVATALLETSYAASLITAVTWTLLVLVLFLDRNLGPGADTMAEALLQRAEVWDHIAERMNTIAGLGILVIAIVALVVLAAENRYGFTPLPRPNSPSRFVLGRRAFAGLSRTRRLLSVACAGLVALSLVALSAHDVNGILVLSALEVRLGADAVRPDTTATGLPREANPSDPAPTDAAYHDASNNLVRREFGAQLRSNGDLSRTIDRWNSTHRDDRVLREWLARRPRWKPAETSHTRPADVATSTTPRTERSSSPAEAVAAVESHLRTCGSDCADIVEDANRAAAEAFESESVGESIVAAAMDFGGGSDFADAMFGEGLFGKLFARAFGETMESIGGNAFAAVAGKINAKLDDRRRTAEAARQRARDAVAAIRENAHGEMPAPEIDNSWTDPSGGARISNDTQYTVTVSFVGPTSRTVSIAPHETVRVLLSPGQYEEAARASAPDVLPFYGSFAQPRGRGLAQRFYIAER